MGYRLSQPSAMVVNMEPRDLDLELSLTQEALLLSIYYDTKY